ncbi:transcription termination factor, RNA polymerase II [Cyanidiococcus yangmingshanensis]|uniref:Transcription termination factor, RNA polymerase II n=1 Tax=Cyanidiococcus yangmingshanensis TaxID=2690220 RepID=A0A7J7IHF3_9RHOD|nr:transcription termination factor, RNA polymerase II [Cyanidiococcus yangmingshanensis]
MELLGREALRRLSHSAADSGVCMHVLVMITRLRQICDHYTLLEPYMCRLRAEQASFRQAPCYERYQRTSDRHSGVCCIACGAPLSPLPRGRSETDDTAAAREALCGYCVAFTGSPSSTLAEDRGDPLDRPFSERDPIRYEPHSLADCSKVVDETISAWTSLLLRDTGVHDGQSSKLRALLALLDRSRLESPDEKWVVFSQWPSFLDICEDALLERGQAVCRVDGLMRYEERELNLELFHRSEYPILLMSIGAGGVGLNLTQANRVVLIDPWWNPAVEEQAIDRVYRLGQRRPVRVTRLVVRDSVEERVMQLQQQKRALYEHVLDSDRRPSVETRLTVRDLHWLMRST